MIEEQETRFQVKFGDVVSELKDWYDNYTRKHPEYNDFIKLVEIVTEEGIEDSIRNTTFRSLIEKAITTKPKDVKIYLEPEQGVYPILAWNSDFYLKRFQEEYLSRIVYTKQFKNNRNFLISLIEYYAITAGMVKLAISAVVNDLVREMLGIYDAPFEEALRKNSKIPFNTIVERVRKNFYVPRIKDKGIDDFIDETERPKSRNVNKYREMIQSFQEEAPIEIRLTPEEIEEEITRRLLDEIVSDDYEEIDS